MKSFALIAIFSLSGTAAGAGESGDIVREANAEIIVTAIPLSRSGANLADCIARQCPPEEDVKATLVHAENLFVAGAYKDAQQTLRKSLDRNRRHKAALPLGVADLLNAQANVASHLGEPTIYRHALFERRDTLHDHLPANDPRALTAELDLGDSRLKMGYPDEAEAKYLAMERFALENGRPQIAAIARIRYLSLLVIRAQPREAEDWRLKKARKEIAKYIENPTPGAEKYALAGELLQLRLDRAAGVQNSTDALIARTIAEGDMKRPALLYAPPLTQNPADAARASRSGNVNHRSLMSAVDKWVDIGFWVNDEGRVEDAEILRNHGDTEWTTSLLRSITGRLYVPAAPSGGARQRFFMIERYTLTAHWERSTGSRLRQRAPMPRIEWLDLTP